MSLNIKANMTNNRKVPIWVWMGMELDMSQVTSEWVVSTAKLSRNIRTNVTNDRVVPSWEWMGMGLDKFQVTREWMEKAAKLFLNIRGETNIVYVLIH